MNVFFTGSPRALSKLKKEHEKIFSTIEDLGFKNLSNLAVNANPTDFYQQDRDKIISHYNETIANLKKADIIVMEVSQHSMSMGFLVNKCLELNKPVIALHLPKHTPFFLSGISNDKLQIVEYTVETIFDDLNESIDYAKNLQDVRFNFFISPKIVNYLDWIAKKKKVPRAVYLRNLIEHDMTNNDEYK